MRVLLRHPPRPLGLGEENVVSTSGLALCSGAVPSPGKPPTPLWEAKAGKAGSPGLHWSHQLLSEGSGKNEPADLTGLSEAGTQAGCLLCSALERTPTSWRQESAGC